MTTTSKKKVNQQVETQQPVIVDPFAKPIGKYLVIEVEALEPIVAPAHCKSYTMYLVQKYNLEQKYGEVALHLDRVFERVYCPVCNKYEPYVTGATLKSAIAMLKTIPKLRYIGVFFREEDVYADTRPRTQSCGKRVAINFEFVAPGSIGHAVIEYFDENAAKELIRSISSKEFFLSGWRSRGFGKARILNIKFV